MKYPIQIENEPELLRLIQMVVRVTLEEQKPAKRTILISKNDCYKAVGGRSLVDKAIASGNLKEHCIEGRVCFKTVEFENWLNKSQL